MLLEGSIAACVALFLLGCRTRVGRSRACDRAAVSEHASRGVTGRRAPLDSSALAAAEDWSGLAAWVMAVLGSRVRLGSASLYVALREVELAARPAATLGASLPSAADHPLVLRALLSGQLAVSPGMPAFDASGCVAAAVPLVTTSGRVLGVVAIYEMPASALPPAGLHDAVALLSAAADRVAERLLQLEGPAPTGVVDAYGARVEQGTWGPI